uniref:Uncharacterized protein n=1 Tax=Tenacibaculum sp. Pbs-1 TaxID=3238748 RepID=A0AB33KZG3_9FLAO
MNVTKLMIVFFLSSFICNSQTKNDDAYYILNENHKDYILRTTGENTNISMFSLYDRIEYEKEKSK